MPEPMIAIFIMVFLNAGTRHLHCAQAQVYIVSLLFMDTLA
jgi:hypothetical protein